MSGHVSNPQKITFENGAFIPPFLLAGFVSQLVFPHFFRSRKSRESYGPITMMMAIWLAHDFNFAHEFLTKKVVPSHEIRKFESSTARLTSAKFVLAHWEKQVAVTRAAEVRDGSRDLWTWPMASCRISRFH